MNDDVSGFLFSAYERMAFIRAFESRVLDLTKGPEAAIQGSVHLCAGQETVPVGVMDALQPKDRVIATYRGHGWALESGVAAEAVLGEICQRSIGINQGRAGSALIMGVEGQFVGENSIVGAGVPIACGWALHQKLAGDGGITVVSIGDGAMSQGAVSEAMAFAAAQALPVLIICENNGWSEMTATDAINRGGRLAKRAAAYGIRAATINGDDPAQVRASVVSAAALLRTGDGPAFLEITVPRVWGHYNRDIEHYRPKADRAAAAERDPLRVLRERMVAVDRSRIEVIDAAVARRLDAVVSTVLESPFPNASAHGTVTAPATQRAPAREARPDAMTMTYQAAVNAALDWALETDSNAVLFGEDVGKAGGIFGASRGLQAKFGIDRVFDTPIAESAILGTAVGAAMAGMHPIAEIMWADFLFVALDQLVNQAANVRYITGGARSVPMVVRTQQGATPGSCAQHSQSVEALLAHVPGLKVGLAASPQDAYDLLLAAIADPDPCVVIEARAMYFDQADVSLHRAPEATGIARRRREGSDAAIITWGTMVPIALEAAAALADLGIDTAVLDLRWLSPIDDDALLRTVEEADGKVVLLHEDNLTGGFGAELFARLHERWRSDRPLRIARVAGDDTRIPSSPRLQRLVRPQVESVTAAVRGLCSDAQGAVLGGAPTLTASA
jgi:2-oxoisovalerate dehydrogenase E1 component